MSSFSEQTDEMIDVTQYLAVFKRKYISIGIVSIVVMFLVGPYILSRPECYEAICNIRISETTNPTALFSIRNNGVKSEMAVIEKKAKILKAVVAILHNKAQNMKAFDGIDSTYMNDDEINYIKSFSLTEESKKYILGIESDPYKFSIVKETLSFINRLKLFNELSCPKLEPLTVKSLVDILEVKTLVTDSDVVEVTATTNYQDISIALANIIAITYRADYGRGQIVEAASTKEFLEKQIVEIQNYLDDKRAELKQYAIKDITLGSPSYYKDKLSELKLELTDLEEEYTAGHEILIRQNKRIEILKKELTVFPEVRMTYEKLDADWKAKKAHLKKIEGLYVEAQINYDAKLLKAKEDIQIIAMAEEGKAANKRGVYALACALFALMIGFGQAVVRDLMKNVLKAEDLEHLSSSRVLAGIPVIKEQWSFFVFWQKFFPSLIDALSFLHLHRRRAINSTEKVLFNYGQVSPLSEAFRSLRTNLLFAIDDKSTSKAIAVTSSIAGEGKTVNAVNLAVSMAKSGKRTLLVDADMRRPKIAQLFNLGKSARGLSDLLIDESTSLKDLLVSSEQYVTISPWDEMMKNTVSENLVILPSGPVPYSPGDLLTSDEFSALVTEMKQSFDFVIFDTPPGLPVSDTSVIGSLVDGVVVVYHDEFRGKYFSSLMKVLEGSKAKIYGIVVNRQRKARGSEYGYGHKDTVLNRFSFLSFR